MTKKKSSRPNSSLGSNQRPEPKSPTQLRRERIIRTASIVIVLALLLSLLAGAFSITPSQAAEPGAHSALAAQPAKSVQVLKGDNSPVGDSVDTDGDGIVNNQDPDVDGDGIVNGKDTDIDGDGIENFDDADPIDSTNIDSNAPEKPDRPAGVGDIAQQPTTWFVAVPVASLILLISALVLAKRRKKRI